MTPISVLRGRRSASVAVVASLLVAACEGATATGPGASTRGEADGPSASEADVPATVSTELLGRERHAAASRQGAAIVRGAADEALYVADEDASALRVAPLPFGGREIESLELPGHPATVLALDDRVLVAVRDPSELVTVVRREGALTIAQRVSLPGDAWGMALASDERSVLVSSAWTHKVSAVDLDSGEVRWTADVAREPRGIVLMPGDDVAYVTHLVGADVTRIDAVRSGQPRVTRVKLPAGALSAPVPGHRGSFELDASLAYAPVLSPDATRLFVPRHAIGGLGSAPWFGRPVVDVLLTADDTPLAPARTNAFNVAETNYVMVEDGRTAAPGLHWTVQPRAATYRRSTDTLVVASEGEDRIVELDPHALDPSLHPILHVAVGAERGPASSCGAPSGIVLDASETHAFVWCRTTSEIARVSLEPASAEQAAYVSVAAPPLRDVAMKGRRLFYATHDPSPPDSPIEDAAMSQGLACAGCHPDGRDDGHVWLHTDDGNIIGSRAPLPPLITRWGGPYLRAPLDGAPRQTPMLAGRVAATGPYGWHGTEATLEDRILAGFSMHRWGGRLVNSPTPLWKRIHAGQAEALAAFLREGLAEPPVELRPLTTGEARGKELFADPTVGCAGCHAPSSAFTNRSTSSLTLAGATPSPAWDARPFRVPSLLFVGGTAPYFHDGHAASLDALVDALGDSMGNTSHLGADDKHALAAYVGTIGLVSVEALPPVERPARVPFAAPAIAETAPPARPETVAAWPDGAPSAMPAPADWKTAQPYPIPAAPKDCRALRIREWLRITCSAGPLDVALVAGDSNGVIVDEGWRGWDSGVAYSGGPSIVMPVRRGDRRYLEIDDEAPLRFCGLSGPHPPYAWLTVSESWLPGEAQPDVVVTTYASGASEEMIEICR